MNSAIVEVSPTVELSPEEQAALDAVTATLRGPDEAQDAAAAVGEEAGPPDVFWTALVQAAALSTGLQCLLAATEWHHRKEEVEGVLPRLRPDDEDPPGRAD